MGERVAAGEAGAVRFLTVDARFRQARLNPEKRHGLVPCPLLHYSICEPLLTTEADHDKHTCTELVAGLRHILDIYEPFPHLQPCPISCCCDFTMPPKRNPEDVQTLKEKLHNTNARGRRTGGTQPTNGSSLKEVDNASTNSGQTSNDLDTSNVSHRLTSLC